VHDVAIVQVLCRPTKRIYSFHRAPIASTSANGVGHRLESFSVVSWTGHRFISAVLPIHSASRVCSLARRIMRFARKWLISGRRRSA